MSVGVGAGGRGESLTGCLALETVASDVRVDALCPGFVDAGLLVDSPLAGILGLDADGLRAAVPARTPSAAWSPPARSPP